MQNEKLKEKVINNNFSERVRDILRDIINILNLFE